MIIFINLLQIFAIIFGFFYSIIRVKKLKPITFEVRRGERCYSCSTEVEHDDTDYMDFDAFKASLEKEDFKLCVRCKREENLDQFIKTGFPDATRINKFKKFLFSKKSDRMIWYFMFAVFTSIIVEFVARFVFDIKLFWFLTPILNIIYWSIFCYKSKITYIKE
jgi:hypothetical protein